MLGLHQRVAVPHHADHLGPVILAHLNGGPRDDAMVALADAQWVFRISKPVALIATGQFSTEIFAMGVESGSYEVRLDSNSDLVPHNLAGAVEYDWKGWA